MAKYKTRSIEVEAIKFNIHEPVLLIEFLRNTSGEESVEQLLKCISGKWELQCIKGPTIIPDSYWVVCKSRYKYEIKSPRAFHLLYEPS